MAKKIRNRATLDYLQGLGDGLRAEMTERGCTGPEIKAAVAAQDAEERMELQGADVCVICGEPGADAEMYDAAMHADPDMFSEAESGLVHAECGLQKGWAIA